MTQAINNCNLFYKDANEIYFLIENILNFCDIFDKNFYYIGRLKFPHFGCEKFYEDFASDVNVLDGIRSEMESNPKSNQKSKEIKGFAPKLTSKFAELEDKLEKGLRYPGRSIFRQVLKNWDRYIDVKFCAESSGELTGHVTRQKIYSYRIFQIIEIVDLA